MSVSRAVDMHRAFALGPGGLVSGLLRERRLVAQLIRREVVGRYRGSVMGLAWSFLHPLLMLAIYTFVFSVVFKARWPELAEGQGRLDFALALFVGVIAHGMLAEAITRAPSLVLSNANYVKKVVFPLETLAYSVVGSSAFHALVSLAILVGAVVLTQGSLPIAALWVPLLFLPILLFALGMAWVLAALGVFLRDIGQISGLFATALMFLAPVFYPAEALPPEHRGWLLLNPITFGIEHAREALFAGHAPPLWGTLLYYAAGAATAWAGFAVFQKLRRGFADVL